MDMTNQTYIVDPETGKAVLKEDESSSVPSTPRTAKRVVRVEPMPEN